MGDVVRPWWALAIVLVLLAGCSAPQTVVDIPSADTGETVLTPAQVRTALVDAFGNVSIPAPAARELLTRDELPSAIGALIIPEAQNVTLAATVYSNGAKGYEISYVVPRPAVDFYSLYFSAQRANWTIVTSQRAAEYGLLEFAQGRAIGRLELFGDGRTSIAVVGT